MFYFKKPFTFVKSKLEEGENNTMAIETVTTFQTCILLFMKYFSPYYMESSIPLV